MGFGYIDNNIGSVEIKDFYSKIRVIIQEELVKYFPDKLKEVISKNQAAKFSSMKELCEELRISRPTITKWLKSENIRPIINPYIHKIGKRHFFEIDGIKSAIRNNIEDFNPDKDYRYKTEVLPDEKERIDRRFSNIQGDINWKKKIKGSDKYFYLDECKKRGITPLIEDDRLTS